MSSHRHRYFIPGCEECDRRLHPLMGEPGHSSAMQLHRWDSVFYVGEPKRCFWCGDPCCRIDIGFEGALCHSGIWRGWPEILFSVVLRQQKVRRWRGWIRDGRDLKKRLRMSRTKEFQEGYKAASIYATFHSNPYPGGSKEWSEWDAGFAAKQRKLPPTTFSTYNRLIQDPND